MNPSDRGLSRHVCADYYDGFLCLVCDVSVDLLSDDSVTDRRCLDCRLRNRTASWRLRFDVNEIAHRTDWYDRFDRVEDLREYYVSRGIGSDHRLQRRVTEGDSA